MYTKETIEVLGSPMALLTFMPEGDGPHPGIVVAQHLPVAHMGLEGDPFTIDVGERLAGAGYACIIPLFGDDISPPRSISAIILTQVCD